MKRKFSQLETSMKEDSTEEEPSLVFVLTGGNRVLTKHKTAICNMSEIVKKGLERQEKETGKGTTSCLIANLGLEEFKILDKFLSTGMIPSDLEIKDCFKLLNFAKSYEIGSLSGQLNIKIKELMRNENVLQVLQEARYQENDELYAFAVDHICKRPIPFIFSEQFKKLGVTDVQAILDCERLNLESQSFSELPVFLAAIAWAKSQVKERMPEPYETFSYFFLKIIHCVRLPLLKPNVIKHLLKAYAALFDEDVVFLLNVVATGLKENYVPPIILNLNIKWWRRGEKFEDKSVTCSKL